MAWYNSAWSYRVPITLPAVGGALTNFPVLVQNGMAAAIAGAKADGTDIIYTTSDGVTKLDRESVLYAGGAMEHWVRVPTYPVGGTTIYAYYGNSGHTEATANTAVWPGYLYVGHWQANANDSSPGGNNGVVTGATNGAEKINNGYSFDGVGDDVNIGDISIDQKYTWHFWAKPKTGGKAVSGNDDGYFVYKEAALEMYFGNSDGASAKIIQLRNRGATLTAYAVANAITFDEYTHFIVTFDGTAGAGAKFKLYENGVNIALGVVGGNDSGAIANDNANPVVFGNNTAGTLDYYGSMDEWRILDGTVWDVNYALADYNNQVNGGTGWYTVGGVENKPRLAGNSRISIGGGIGIM